MDQTTQLPASSALCDQVPLSPSLVTGAILHYLQTYFSDPGRIINPALRDNVWTKEPATTKILITPFERWNPENAQQRPSIVVRREQANQMPPLSIGDQFHRPMDLLGAGVDANQATLGHNQQLTMVAGDHTLFCVHASGGGAETLGNEVFARMIDWQKLIQHDLNLFSFRVVGLSAITHIQEFRQSGVTVVGVQYKFLQGVVLRSLSPLLKSITLNLE
jgi:hypothetical protein